jgi:hypothetical protein
MFCVILGKRGVDMSKLTWSLSDDLRHFDLDDSGASLGVWRDRKALYLENGSAVLLRDEFKLDCFRLQAEIAIPGSEGYIGLVFGARDSNNHELVYISPGIDTGLGEIQYDPVMNGSNTWQIYNGTLYQAPAPIISGEWVKFSIDVQSNNVAICVGENTAPQLVITNLQHERSTGRIGVWGYLPGYIRNLSVEEIQPKRIDNHTADLKQLTAETFVTEWIVSKPYLNGEQPCPVNTWLRAFVEENGTLNVNRLYRSAKGNCVQTKCMFYIPEGKETWLTLGFSDHLRLWINEEEIYQGEWKWSPPGSDGRIRNHFAGIAVHWQAGLNTIRAEIMDQEAIFGWGLSIKTGLPNLSFITDEK